MTHTTDIHATQATLHAPEADDSYKVWLRPKPKSVALPSTPQPQARTRATEAGLRHFATLSSGPLSVQATANAAALLLCYEPRAKGQSVLVVEGFAHEADMTLRVKEIRVIHANVLGAYDTATHQAIRVKIQGGVVSYFRLPRPRVTAKPKSAQELLAAAEKSRSQRGRATRK